MLNLGRQYRIRQRAWREELMKHLYTPIGEMPVEGFTTMDRLTMKQVKAKQFRPYHIGEEWGACWEYAWFQGNITLPESCVGKRVVLLGDVGGEQLYYVNGTAIGSIDKGHTYVTLTKSSTPGESFHVLIESYAGHGARLENLGPCPPERAPIPPTPDTQCVVGKNIVAIWNEDAYQLMLDVHTLDKLLQILPDQSLRAQRVAAALQSFSDIVDFELPFEARQETFRQARNMLREVMGCHNGSTAPLMWLIGQSHIDLAWLWHMDETFHKSVRTYSNQMTLLDEYPEYQYLLCEPALLDMLREQDMDLWERVKAAHKRGQIKPDGAFYVECDTNIPSGESIIRQLLWGKRWFHKHFGEDSQVAWLPDCFGFTGALPQILKGMRVPFFATQKLQRADPECERFPYHHFIWEGIDGSEVLGLSFIKDNGPIDPTSFKERWEDNRVQLKDIDTLLHPFGYGDGGGGPTRDMVELSLRLKDLEGVPRSHYGSLQEYFQHIQSQGVKNRWVGELYLSWHRGTFTSQRRSKALMRRAEMALHDTESLAARMPIANDIRLSLHEMWRKLLLCQFHDIAGGVGIHRTHAEADNMLQDVINSAQQMASHLRNRAYKVIEKDNSTVLYNALSWDRTEWLLDEDDVLHYVYVPADGVAPLRDLDQPKDVQIHYEEKNLILENRYISLTLDKQGAITELVDKANNLSMLDPMQKMNDWRLYKNVQTVYDAWEVDRNWELQEIKNAFTVQVDIQRNTSQMCELRILRQFGTSSSEQRIRMFASSRRIDFITQVDWHERHKMLKTHFESNIWAEDAIHEIQFGYMKRPAHRSTRFAADRYETCNHRYSALCEDKRGFALLNDGIYGVSANRGELALTLLRAPLVPDDTNNQGHHELTYALYVFDTSLADSYVARRGYELNSPIIVQHDAYAAATSGLRVNDGNVILETIKPAEDGNGLILRLYNSQYTHESAILELPWSVELFQCEMNEAIQNSLGQGNRFELTFSPFHICTLRALRDDRLSIH